VDYSKTEKGELEERLRRSTEHAEREALRAELHNRYLDLVLDERPPPVEETKSSQTPESPISTMQRRSRPARSVGWIITSVIMGTIALAFLGGALIYALIPAGHLPGHFGYVPGSAGHHRLRGTGCLLIGISCATIWGLLVRVKRRGEV